MAADLDWLADDMDTPCFMLVKTTAKFKDLLTKEIGTSYDFLSDTSMEIETMIGGYPVALTTADITNEILNDSSLSQQIYVLLSAKSALVIFDQIASLIDSSDPQCPFDYSRIDSLMKYRINLFLEVTLEGQQDQDISKKVKYLMLLLSDVLFKYQVSAKSVVNDLSSKKELASICKYIEEQIKSTGNNAYDTLRGNGEASEIFFNIVQPQQKFTKGKRVKRKQEKLAMEKSAFTPRPSYLAKSIEPPTVVLEDSKTNLDTGGECAIDSVPVKKIRRSMREKAALKPGAYDTNKHPNQDQLPKQ